MARLKKCKDCGHDVSKKAKTCPNCGSPIKTEGHIGCIATLAVLGVVFWIIYMVADDASYAPNPQPRGPSAQPTAQPDSASRDYWVTSDRLNRRTCPSADCGVVGRYLFREKATVFETKDGWARVTKRYQAACENGRSRFVDEGKSDCTPENGIKNGQFAEWVSMQYLSKTRPPDPAAGATGTAELVAGSDDYRVHKDAFIEAAERLINDGRCSANDFRENGGWAKSTTRRDQPIYFMYCGGFTNANRLYLDASTGRIFK